MVFSDQIFLFGFLPLALLLGLPSVGTPLRGLVILILSLVFFLVVFRRLYAVVDCEHSDQFSWRASRLSLAETRYFMGNIDFEFRCTWLVQVRGLRVRES